MMKEQKSYKFALMVGKWEGYYKYDNPIIQDIMGFDQTNFTITVEEFHGSNFNGKVNDDIATGGMKETGKIIGKVVEDKITFEKLMPKNQQIINLQGDRKTHERKHPTIYYTGVLSKNQTEASGSWYFKKRIGFRYGFLPVFYNPAKGTWKMKLKINQN